MLLLLFSNQSVRWLCLSIIPIGWKRWVTYVRLKASTFDQHSNFSSEYIAPRAHKNDKSYVLNKPVDIRSYSK